MSHFTVMVVTDDAADVDEALAPFHEFECTGIDRFIQEVDDTEELRAEYLSNLKAKLEKAAGSSGETDADTQTFADWVADWTGRELVTEDELKADGLTGQRKYGYILVDDKGKVVRCIDRTNPTTWSWRNAAGEEVGRTIKTREPDFDTTGLTKFQVAGSEWDWYQMGGRWSGMLQVKPGARAATGEPGVMGSKYSDDGVDQCRAGDLDLDAMLAEARQRRAKAWDGAVEEYTKSLAGFHEPRADGDKGPQGDLGILADGGRPSFEEALGRYGDLISELRASMEDSGGKPLYKLIEEHPEAAALRTVLSNADWKHGIEPHRTTRQQYIDGAVAFSTFAVLKDGCWYERGNMGWFGIVIDEKDEGEWERQFNELLRSLRPDQVITIIDCHI